MKNYSELKSGSDVRGYASDIFQNEVNLTDEAVYDITAAFVLFVQKKSGKNPQDLTISVGHDSRITAEKIKAKVIELCNTAGVSLEKANRGMIMKTISPEMKKIADMKIVNQVVGDILS